MAEHRRWTQSQDTFHWGIKLVSEASVLEESAIPLGHHDKCWGNSGTS